MGIGKVVAIYGNVTVEDEGDGYFGILDLDDPENIGPNDTYTGVASEKEAREIAKMLSTMRKQGKSERERCEAITEYINGRMAKEKMN